MPAGVVAPESPISRMVTPAGVADPYPLFDELRSQRPVCFDEVYGVWVCTSHAVVHAVLSDPTMSSARLEGTGLWDPERLPAAAQATAREVYAALGERMLMQDPPEHTATRRVMSAAFGRRAVGLLRPRVETLVDELLAPAAATGRLEVVGDLAAPLSLRVIAELLGIPARDIGSVERWAADFAASKDVHPDDPGREAAAVRGVAELLAYLGDVVAERRAGRRRDDVLQLVVDAAEGEGPAGQARLAANLAGLLVGGHDTTTSLISTGLLSLVRFPGERAQLAADPSLLAPAVEELLRFESPAQWILRRATEERILGGQAIRPGELVGLFLGAANRDPAVFADPARLDLSRRPHQHFAFGRGRHLCIGAPLARLEGTIALGAVVAAFPRLELAGPPPAWTSNFANRGLARLELSVGPGRRDHRRS